MDIATAVKIENLPSPILVPLLQSHRSTDTVDKVLYLMQTAEAVAQLAGTIVMIDAWEQNHRKRASRDLTTLLKKLRLSESYFGTWRLWVEKVSPLLRNPFLLVLDDAGKRKEINSFLGILVSERNKLGHPMHRPDPSKAPLLLENAEFALNRVLSLFDYFEQYKLMAVQEGKKKNNQLWSLRVWRLHGVESSMSSSTIESRTNLDSKSIILVRMTDGLTMVLSPAYRLLGSLASPSKDLFAFSKDGKPGSAIYKRCSLPDDEIKSAILEDASPKTLRSLYARSPTAGKRPSFVFKPEWSRRVLRSVENLCSVRHLPLDNIEKIAVGGMSTVYKGFDRDTREPRVLKVVELNAPQDHHERLRREAKVLKNLKHPNLIEVKETCPLPDGKLGIIEEYFEGKTLKAILANDRPSQEVLLRIIRALVDGLHELHNKDIVHRDIKPSNVMIDDEARKIRIIDLGLAKDLTDDSDDLTTAGERLGTKSYAAPEQWDPKKGKTTIRSDIYSLGLVICEMFSGQAPHYDVDQLKEIKATLPSYIQKIVDGCVHEKPNRRFSRVGKIRDLLDQWEKIEEKAEQEKSDHSPTVANRQDSLFRLLDEATSEELTTIAGILKITDPGKREDLVLAISAEYRNCARHSLASWFARDRHSFPYKQILLARPSAATKSDKKDGSPSAVALCCFGHRSQRRSCVRSLKGAS